MNQLKQYSNLFQANYFGIAKTSEWNDEFIIFYLLC